MSLSTGDLVHSAMKCGGLKFPGPPGVKQHAIAWAAKRTPFQLNTFDSGTTSLSDLHSLKDS